MSFQEIFTVTSEIVGGLALFIFGMRTMSQGLKDFAGQRLRKILAGATRNRASGLGLGTLLGFLIQSSASTVMLVGFINSGLMSLFQSIAPMLGANIGTTLSMQLISFKLSDYCLAVIACGLIIQLTTSAPRLKNCGKALLGFGLLFLGMKTMSAGLQPYRASLQPFLAQISGATLGGLLTGVLLSAGITAIIQSSGATIGMGFALVSAGAITDFQEIYPLIVGANIGTCVTALLGSIGANIDARRAAISHLIFNLESALLGILTAPLFFRYIDLTSGDIIHQAANANTIKMVISALCVLPFMRYHAALVRLILPARKPQPEPSHLDRNLLKTPELAIVATLRELQRTTKICTESIELSARELLYHKRQNRQSIALNEHSINDIKKAMKDYLATLTEYYLSKRQAVLIQHIDRCMSDLERIMDHIENLSIIAQRQRKIPAAHFTPQMITEWLALYRKTAKLLALLAHSLDTEANQFYRKATKILEFYGEYTQTVAKVKKSHLSRIEKKQITPIAGILFSDYISNFERITKHIHAIATAEQQPQFQIKEDKFERVMSPEAPGYAIPKKIDPEDYLDQLNSEV